VKRKRESVPDENLLIEGVPGIIRTLRVPIIQLQIEAVKRRLSLFRLSDAAFDDGLIVALNSGEKGSFQTKG